MPLHVRPKILEHVGRIVALQSHIERGIALSVMSLARLDQEAGDAMCRRVNLRTLTEMADALLSVRFPKADSDADELRQLLARADAASKKRNEYVHSMWSFGPEFNPKRPSRVRPHGKSGQLKGTVVTYKELRELIKEMRSILEMLEYIHPRVRRPA